MGDPQDERFKIEGDPEDALRGMLGADAARRFTVHIGERDSGVDLDGGAPRVADDRNVVRLFEWTGSARDRDDAIEQAHAAFEGEHGGRPHGNYSVHVIPG